MSTKIMDFIRTALGFTPRTYNPLIAQFGSWDCLMLCVALWQPLYHVIPRLARVEWGRSLMAFGAPPKRAGEMGRDNEDSSMRALV